MILLVVVHGSPISSTLYLTDATLRERNQESPRTLFGRNDKPGLRLRTTPVTMGVRLKSSIRRRFVRLVVDL